LPGEPVVAAAALSNPASSGTYASTSASSRGPWSKIIPRRVIAPLRRSPSARNPGC